MMQLPPAALAAGLMQPPQPQDPFVFGEGGARLTPEDIALRRQIAMQQQQSGMDFSPVASPWQGLARVAQGLVGGLETKRLDKASKANEADAQARIAALLQPQGGAGTGGVNPALIQALTSSDPRVSGVGKLLFEQQNKAPPTPYRFEDNAGNGYERGPDGTNRLIFVDPNDKQFVVDGQLVTVPNVVRQSQSGMGAKPPSGPPPEAVAELQADPSAAAEFDQVFGQGAAARILGQGGQTPPASGTFP